MIPFMYYLVQCNSLLSVSCSMYFLTGVQQNDTSRVTGPSEKPLQQAEPFNSHHKTKKLRLDESLSGGLIMLLPDRFIASISDSFIQDVSLKHVCLILLLSLLLFLSFIFPNLAFFNFLPPQWPLSQGWGTRECAPPA